MESSSSVDSRFLYCPSGTIFLEAMSLPSPGDSLMILPHPSRFKNGYYSENPVKRHFSPWLSTFHGLVPLCASHLAPIESPTT